MSGVDITKNSCTHIHEDSATGAIRTYMQIAHDGCDVHIVSWYVDTCRGCGAFGGDIGLKAMVQWIAATKVCSC